MAERAAATLNCSDVFRSYDMVKALSVSEVLDRQSKLYTVAATYPGTPSMTTRRPGAMSGARASTWSPPP